MLISLMSLPQFLTQAVEPVLDAAGMEALGGGRYVLRREDCLAGLDLVDTLRAKSSTYYAGFVIHLWVLSNRLSAVFGPRARRLPKYIGAEDVHWHRDAIYISERKRIGTGRWLVESSDAGALNQAVADVQKAATELEARASDRGLVREWLARRDVWLSEARQAAYVSVLLRALGRQEKAWELATLVRVLAEHGDREATELLERLDRAQD